MQKIKEAHQPPNVHIVVENFGPIEKAEIDLRPLTVFVGESNTGKTYLAALVYALHQNFDGFSQLPWASRAGSYLNYHSRVRLSGMENKSGEEILESLEKLNMHGSPFTFSDFPKQMRSWLESNLKESGAFEDELQRCFDLEAISNLIRFARNTHNGLRVSMKVQDEDLPLWYFDMRYDGSNSTVDAAVNGDMVIRPEVGKVIEETLDIEDLVALLRIPRSKSAEAYYLPAARSGIMQSHGVIASSLVDRATRVGLERLPEIATFSGMIADFLKHIIEYEQPYKSSVEMINIAKALETEVIRGGIEVSRPVAGGYPAFLYRPEKTEQVLRMSQSSSMVSELAPLVLFLRGVVQPGDTLIIEEPEAHLHPAAQTKVALTLAHLVRVGVRVIITTHSDWLLEQIGNLVREGEVMKLEKNKAKPVTWLTKEEVGAWWFRENEPVKEIAFEHIAGIEPEEYGEVAEQLYNRSVDLRAQLEGIMGGTEGEEE